MLIPPLLLGQLLLLPYTPQLAAEISLGLQVLQVRCLELLLFLQLARGARLVPLRPLFVLLLPFLVALLARFRGVRAVPGLEGRKVAQCGGAERRCLLCHFGGDAEIFFRAAGRCGAGVRSCRR